MNGPGLEIWQSGGRRGIVPDIAVTVVGEGLSILMNVHIPHYSMSGVDYRVGYKTCRHQAGSPPSSPLQNRKSYFNK